MSETIDNVKIKDIHISGFEDKFVEIVTCDNKKFTLNLNQTKLLLMSADFSVTLGRRNKYSMLKKAKQISFGKKVTQKNSKISKFDLIQYE